MKYKSINQLCQEIDQLLKTNDISLKDTGAWLKDLAELFKRDENPHIYKPNK